MNDLPQLRKRFRKGRRPFYEVLCNCGVYNYPHRFGGGYCNGLFLVEFFWEKGMCGNCKFREYDDGDRCQSCQVVNGRENIIECEQLQDFLRVNEAFSKRFLKR
jgi:hypothetical protein